MAVILLRRFEINVLVIENRCILILFFRKVILFGLMKNKEQLLEVKS